MNKKILFWIFFTIGIFWIAGVSYWYISEVENLNFNNIHWNENFSSKDPSTQAFFRGVLWVIVPLIITAFIFYFMGLFFGKKAEDNLHIIEQENEKLKNKLAQHVNKLEDMKVLYTGGIIEKRKKHIKNEKSNEEKYNFIDTQQIKGGILENKEISSSIIKDDLKIIEGIGERIEFFLNENGIYTWEQLASTTEEKLKNILWIYGGDSYKIHNPSSWPEQANLASNRRWDELNHLKEKIRKKIN